METLASARAGVKRPPNLRESVYQMLRDRIQFGEIGFEEKLVDQDIASRLNISRMPVREALMQLKSEGALESTARGFILRRYTPRQMNEGFEVRRLIEPQAAVMACMAADGGGLQGMRQVLDQVAQSHAIGDNAAFLRYKACFRGAWMVMVPNRTLVEAIERFYDHVHVARLLTVDDAAMRALTLENMLSLYNAFASGDSARVRSSVLAQLDAVAARYNAAL